MNRRPRQMRQMRLSIVMERQEVPATVACPLVVGDLVTIRPGALHDQGIGRVTRCKPNGTVVIIWRRSQTSRRARGGGCSIYREDSLVKVGHVPTGGRG